MATENNHDNKESVPEKSAVTNEIKATESEKSEALPASATDKLNDATKVAGNVFTKARGLANDAIKTAKSDATKQSLNDAAKTAGAIGSKFLAKAKVVAEDVKKELKEVNDIRKDTVANAEVGTSKKALAKGFWAKLSGKQKGLLTGIGAICVYFSYSVLFSGGNQSGLPPRTQAVAECGVLNLTLGTYLKQTGETAQGDRLLRSALTWGKTAFKLGELEGVKGDAVKTENERLSKYVAKNTADYMSTTDQRMKQCLALLKSDKEILSIWQNNQ